MLKKSAWIYIYSREFFNVLECTMRLKKKCKHRKDPTCENQENRRQTLANWPFLQPFHASLQKTPTPFTLSSAYTKTLALRAFGSTFRELPDLRFPLDSFYLLRRTQPEFKKGDRWEVDFSSGRWWLQQKGKVVHSFSGKISVDLGWS